MATHTLYMSYPTGATLYAYPRGQSLADWLTHRVALTESAAPDEGAYTATLDDTTGNEWAVFEGSDQPGSWGEYAAAAVLVPSANVVQVNGVTPTVITSIGEAAGSGAYAVTVTVDDGTDPLGSARVRLAMGSQSFVASTNAAGVASFSLDTGTYTLSITKGGYTFTPESVVVSGAAALTRSMDVFAITPSAAGLTTGYVTCYDNAGAVQAGVTIEVRMVTAPGESGKSYTTATRTATSGASGLVEFEGLIRKAKYEARRGDGDWVGFNALDADSTPMPAVLGTA